MKNLFIYMLLPVLTAVLPGCETEAVDVRVPEFEQKLVVTAFISPSEKVSYFNVTSNWETYGLINTEHSLGNLEGTITDGVNTATLDTFRSGLKLDQNKLKIEYGKTYNLRIENDHGLVAEASCRIPEKKAFTVKADTAWVLRKYHFGDNEKILMLKISVNDVPGEKNYYTLKVTGDATGRPFGSLIGVQVHTEPGYMIKSDKGLDGHDLTWEIEAGWNKEYKYDSASYTIRLYHTEESYFLYHNSLRLYENGSNPFSEATPVYSNVKGGLGVFTSYTVDSLVYTLK